MYTLQALWTQARERLDVVTVIYANRAYKVLIDELAGVGAGAAGAKAMSLFDLDNPALDWVALAHGMGVEAVRVETVRAFDDALRVGAGRAGAAAHRGGGLTLAPLPPLRAERSNPGPR